MGISIVLILVCMACILKRGQGASAAYANASDVKGTGDTHLWPLDDYVAARHALLGFFIDAALWPVMIVSSILPMTWQTAIVNHAIQLLDEYLINLHRVLDCKEVCEQCP